MSHLGRLLPAVSASVAACFVLIRLDQEGFANEYYAAAVRSMLLNTHNLFFAAFDPAGFLAVDKPPVGLWVQALSVLLFGFHGWSLILPQALSAIASVVILHRLVQRDFGPLAGFVAGLVLALTPISVATARNNTMDSQLVLICLLAAWASRVAAETGRLRWLLAAFALIGLGFNVKMAQALLVLPAILLVYLLTASLRWRVRLLHLGLATLLMLALSLSWAVAVDLTPASQRPYVASTQGNSVLELIVGHNAASRLGLRLSSGDTPARARAPVALATPFEQETGTPGPFRLFSQALAGQSSWLLPFALAGAVLASTTVSWRKMRGARARSLILWATWLTPMIGFVSIAGLMHRYYLSMLAPAIAALVGIGIGIDWERRAHGKWRLALGASVAVSAIVTWLTLGYWPQWQASLTVPLALLSAPSILLLMMGGASGSRVRRAFGVAGLAASIASLLLVPTVWSSFPVIYGGDRHLPYAGPELAEAEGRRSGDAVPQQLVDMLTRRSGEARFIAATLNANAAAPLILASGKAVMAVGGFTGSDPILTIEQLASRVAAGEVHFFWIPAQVTARGPQPNRGNLPGNRDLQGWVYSHCTLRLPAGRQPSAPGVLPGAAGQPPGDPDAPTPPAAGAQAEGPLTLYECVPPSG